MYRALKTIIAIVLVAGLAGTVSAAAPGKEPSAKPAFRIGLEAGYAGRSVRWDGGTDGSKVKTLLAGLAAEADLAYGIGVGVFAGLGSSDPGAAVFRELPISLDYGAGAMPAFAFGAEVRKSLVSFGRFETGARARFVIYTGPSKRWPIAGFAVEGEASGRLKWSELEVGPTVTYRGGGRFAPYAGIFVNWFRGNFRMAETLGELNGQQARKLAQNGVLRLALGTSFEIGRGFSVVAEGGVVPAKGATDAGATVRLLYGF